MSTKESGSELEYERQTEIEFRASARAMRLFGQWIADKMGLSPEEHADYAKSMITVLMEHGGDGGVLAKVKADMAARGVTLDDHEVREAMVRIRQEARQYVLDNPA